MAKNQGVNSNQFLGRSLGTVAMVWGMLGVICLLSYGVSKMIGHTREGFTYSLGIWHYVVLVVWTFFMAYSEGYKGFQKGFSPRVAARAVYLRDRSTWWRLILAPPFCMGFFAAPRKRQITVVVLLIGITLLVMLFRMIPQPWRGVLDFGVIVGLSWGILATLIFFAKFCMQGTGDVDAQVVETVASVKQD